MERTLEKRRNHRIVYIFLRYCGFYAGLFILLFNFIKNSLFSPDDDLSRKIKFLNELKHFPADDVSIIFCMKHLGNFMS